MAAPSGGCGGCGAMLAPGMRICARCGWRVQAAPAAAPAVPRAQPVAAPAPARSYALVPAGFWRRVAAFGIDFIALGVASWAAQQVLPVFGGLVIWWMYFALFETSSWQATPGKRLLKLKVTDVNGVHLRLGRATLRFAARLLSAAPLFLGFVIAAFTPHKQALHDLVASTLVLDAR